MLNDAALIVHEEIRKRNLRLDMVKNITYVLLGDATGAIVLIDEENFGKLKKLKVRNKVTFLVLKETIYAMKSTTY